jgi:hypothetical protein
VLAWVEAGMPYRIWIRGKADRNRRVNDSVFVQFSSSVTAAGDPTDRIGTTSATTIQLADCTTCYPSGWGWQDNGSSASRGTLGPPIVFANTGWETVRIQTREDGLSIDQIVLSPATYLNTPPGTATGDTTILAQS